MSVESLACWEAELESADFNGTGIRFVEVEMPAMPTTERPIPGAVGVLVAELVVPEEARNRFLAGRNHGEFRAESSGVFSSRCSLRASFEKLAVLVEECLSEAEHSSQVFVFTNKRKNRAKILYWNGTGLWILTKKT